MAFYVYILRNGDNKLYIGQTKNVEERLLRHNTRRGVRFVRDNKFEFNLVYIEQFDTQVEAMRRVKQLKGWTRAKKEALIAGDIQLLKML